MSDDRYEVVTWRGFKFDRLTIAAIEAAEELLGRKFRIMQGSYNQGKVGASAGTHDGGGAVDFAVEGLNNRDVRVLRVVGFAAWHRIPSEGPWSEHIHAVLIGNERLAPSAARQVEAYKAGRNGLVSNKRDDTWRPSKIPTFQYPEEDMPNYREWQKADKDALARDIADAVWAKTIPTDDAPGKPRYVLNAIKKVYDATFPGK